VIIKDVSNRKEEISLLDVLKAVFASKAEFLGNTSDTERLARKSTTKNIVRRDVGNRYSMDIAVGSFVEVRFVGLLAINPAIKY
jgi:hypothetical protein